MAAIVESLIPIFLLIAAGHLLMRIELVGEDAWKGMEKLSFYVFFPSLLGVTLYRADFSGLGASAAAAGFFAGICVALFAGLLIRKPVEILFGLSPASYSSVYQGFTRWNGFIALAIAEKLYGDQALAIVAIAMGAMIIPINVVNIAVVAALGESEQARPNPWRQVVTNPLVISVLVGTLLNLLRIPVHEPLLVTVDLLGRIALPLGLLLVGAGVRLTMSRAAIPAAIFTSAMKLLVMPLLLAGACVMFGLSGEDVVAAAICGGVPTAMNGYIIARQLGGDAPFFAQIATAQVIAACLTLPAVILAASWYAGV